MAFSVTVLADRQVGGAVDERAVAGAGPPWVIVAMLVSWLVRQVEAVAGRTAVAGVKRIVERDQSHEAVRESRRGRASLGPSRLGRRRNDRSFLSRWSVRGHADEISAIARTGGSYAQHKREQAGHEQPPSLHTLMDLHVQANRNPDS